MRWGRIGFKKGVWGVNGALLGRFLAFQGLVKPELTVYQFRNFLFALVICSFLDNWDQLTGSGLHIPGLIF